MHIDEFRYDGISLLEPQNMGVIETGEFRSKIRDILDDGRCDFVINLLRFPRMDIADLETLMAIMKEVLELGGTFKFLARDCVEQMIAMNIARRRNCRVYPNTNEAFDSYVEN